MSFTAKQIEGAVVKKAKCNKYCYDEQHIKDCSCDRFNGAIDKQSSVPLEFDREKLAKTIFNYTFPHNEEFDSWEKLTEYSKQSFYKEADAICAADKEIVERAE